MTNDKHYRNAIASWNGTLPYTYEGLRLAVLCQIRDELANLNGYLRCHNVATGFRALAKLARQHDALFKRRVEAAVRKRRNRATSGVQSK